MVYIDKKHDVGIIIPKVYAKLRLNSKNHFKSQPQTGSVSNGTITLNGEVHADVSMSPVQIQKMA